jgi:hypothetical protein
MVHNLDQLVGPILHRPTVSYFRQKEKKSLDLVVLANRKEIDRCRVVCSRTNLCCYVLCTLQVCYTMIRWPMSALSTFIASFGLQFTR